MGVPIFAGWLVWRVGFQARPDGHSEAAWLARVLSRFALIGCATPLMFLVSWVAPLPGGRAVAIPFISLAVHLTGSLAGWAVSRLQGHPPGWQAAFLLGGGCSNVLTFGGITIVLLLATPEDPGAEKALGLLAFYRLLEPPFYFLVAWPSAAMVAAAHDPVRARWSSFLWRALRSPAVVPVLGILIGALLNVGGVERPELFDGTAQWLVRVNVILLGIPVGLGLRRAAPMRYLGPCVSVALIKFVWMPLVGVGLAWALGFQGMTLQVIAIASAMPVAFMAVVGAALYRLDDKLIGSFWVFTTAAMVIVIPLLAVVVPRLGGG